VPQGAAEPRTRSDKFNNSLVTAVISTAWFPPGQSKEDRNLQLFVAVTGLQAFAPTDEIEGMIAAQAMTAHHASMECSRRAMVPDQPFEAAQGFRKAAANASRTFVELLSALDRKRGKGGHQVVRVEHVHVHQGGQAIVGNVQGSDTRAETKAAPPLAIGQEQSGITLGDLIDKQPELVRREGGYDPQFEAEPRASAPRLAHDTSLGAVLSPLRGTDAERETVPVAGDAERQVSNARRR
jgi:hypothetical protein